MAEFWFYHLTRTRLEDTLPTLLERSLARGWKAVVQAGSEERVAALDDHLWTYRDESFLPHGSKRGAADGAAHPVWLTDGGDNPNGAQVRFLVDGADCADVDAYERVILLFDGHDEDQLSDARARWKALKAQGLALSYWKQNEDGGWAKQA